MKKGKIIIGYSLPEELPDALNIIQRGLGNIERNERDWDIMDKVADVEIDDFFDGDVIITISEAVENIIISNRDILEIADILQRQKHNFKKKHKESE